MNVEKRGRNLGVGKMVEKRGGKREGDAFANEATGKRIERKGEKKN